MTTGYIQAILYIISIAISTIWIDRLGEYYGTWFLLFGSSVTAAIFFNLVSHKRFFRNHYIIFKDIKTWFIVSMSVLVCWFVTYEATIISSARVLISLLFTATAAISSIYTKKYLKVSFCSIAIVFIYYTTPESNLMSLAASILGGFSFFIYFKCSTAYAKNNNLKAIDVLATRFYLLIIASFCIYFFSGENAIHDKLHSTYVIILILVLLGLLNMVVPNYFSQNSCLKIGAEKFSILTSFLPPVTFFIQGCFYHDWDLNIFFACVFVSLALNYDLIYQKIRRGLL